MESDLQSKNDNKKESGDVNNIVQENIDNSENKDNNYDNIDDEKQPLNSNNNNKKIINNMEDKSNNNNNNEENNNHITNNQLTNNNNNNNETENNLNNEEEAIPWSRRRIIVTIIRSTIVTVGLIVVFLNTLFGFVLPSGNIDCVIDYTHTGTSGINEALIKNDSLRRGLMITSALFLDILFLTKIGFFIFKSRTWRLIVSIIIFYLVRSLAQVMFQEKFPDGYAWYYPGFPSITVSYLKANDFYFNSSTGLLLICGLDFYHENQMVFFILCLVSIVFQSLMLIFLRGQYIIDIFSSLIIAHFVVMNVNDYIHYLDYNKVIGFYTEKSKELIENEEGNKEE